VKKEMLDALIKSLSNFRVANYPVGEGTLLTINTMIGEVGKSIGVALMRKMRVPTLPAKLIGGGGAALVLPMIVKATKIGGQNAADRLAIAATSVVINDIIGTQQIIRQMLKAIPLLSGVEVGELGEAEEEYIELPSESVEKTELEGISENDLGYRVAIGPKMSQEEKILAEIMQ